MAGTKSASIQQLLRSAAARANAQTSGALRRRDRDLANLIQAGTTSAGRAVLRMRIWERYLSIWAVEFVKAYAKSAGKFGPPDALAPLQLSSVRSATKSHTVIGIIEMRQSLEEDYARTADGSPRPAAARYVRSLLAKVMAAADVEINALADEGELRLGQSAAEGVPVTGQLELDDSPAGRQARLQKFLVDHPGVRQVDVAQAANVNEPEVTQWKKGNLRGSSSMTQRIEKVLRGEMPLKPRSHR
jgi:hypothetical protein